MLAGQKGTEGKEALQNKIPPKRRHRQDPETLILLTTSQFPLVSSICWILSTAAGPSELKMTSLMCLCVGGL